MMTLIKDWLGLDKVKVAFKQALSSEPYVWEIHVNGKQNYCSWGHSLWISNGQLKGYMSRPKIQTGDLVIFTSTTGKRCACLLLDDQYFRDPWDMIETAPLLQIGYINEEGELTEFIHNSVKPIKAQEEALRHYCTNHKQLFDR